MFFFKFTTSFDALYEYALWSSMKVSKDRLTVLMWIPSGVKQDPVSAKYGLRIVDEGNTLEVTYMWPKVVTDISTILQKAKEKIAFWKTLNHWDLSLLWRLCVTLLLKDSCLPQQFHYLLL